MAKVTIKRGSIVVNLKRTDLLEATGTHDGVVFNFKNGLFLYDTDPNTPIATKDIIRNTASNFPGKNLIFDLLNYNRPAVIDGT